MKTAKRKSKSSRAFHPRVELTLINRSRRAVPQKFLRDWVADLAREAADVLPSRLVSKFSDREFVIAFVSSDEIRALNKQFRGKDKPTDVLSFEGDDPSSMGELAISPEIIAVQAREHGLLIREELGYMILHGFLHLLGFDHETGDADARRMFKLQDAMFERILVRMRPTRVKALTKKLIREN